VYNPGLVNALALEPFPNRLDSFLRWGKHIMHLLCCPVFSILDRGWVRAMEILAIGRSTATKSNNLHFHEQGVALVQIVLG
jgi:hypothetical protein